MSSAGTIIWSAIPPNLKLMLSICCGAIMVKIGRFSPEASRGAAQLSFIICLPALMFASIIPAFNSENINNIGPLFLVSSLYEIIGLGLAWLIRFFLPVPADFQVGILLAGMASNTGNSPLALISSVGLLSPFDGQNDVTLGTSYISIFILVFQLSLFGSGAYKFIENDYKPRKAPPTSVWERWQARKEVSRRESQATYNDKSAEAEEAPEEELSHTTVHAQPTEVIPKSSPSSERPISPSSLKAHSAKSGMTRRKAALLFIWDIVTTPITTALIISLPISLIKPLRALFTPTEGWTGTRMPNAPDGLPPLAFLLTFASYVGLMAVPLQLILLGASLARMSVPKPWSRLPIAASLALMTTKMVLLPIFGVFFCQALTKHTDLLPADKKMLRFTSMIASGAPTSVNQLIITALSIPPNSNGTLDSLACFLIVQYAFMFFGSTILTAISIKLVS